MQSTFPLSHAHDSDRAELFQLGNARLVLYPECFSPSVADRLMRGLLDEIPWQQDTLSFGGRRVKVPRLQAWYGDSGMPYSYSGLNLTPLPWTRTLTAVRRRVEYFTGARFNAVLLNYYRDGHDSVAWHSDSERELGKDPIVASLSLGATRRFELKEKHPAGDRPARVKYELPHGSLLVMERGIQAQWLHRVPKQPEVSDPRINLTFRHIVR